MRNSISSLLIAGLMAGMLLATLVAAVMHPDQEMLRPYQGCCSILIDHDQHTVTYLSELGIDVEYFDDQQEMLSLVNAMQEHCYSEHYSEY